MNSHDDILSSVDLLGNELKHGDTVAILVTPCYQYFKHRIITEGWMAGEMHHDLGYEYKPFTTKDLIAEGYTKPGRSCWKKPFDEDHDDNIYRGLYIRGYDKVVGKWKSSKVDHEIYAIDEERRATTHDNGIGVIRAVIYRMRKVKKDEVNLLQVKTGEVEPWEWIDILNECVIKDNGELTDEELIAKFQSAWK